MSGLFEVRCADIDDDKKRREIWYETISPIFAPKLDKSEPLPKENEFRCYNLGKILFSDLTASPQSVERTQSTIAKQAVDHIVLRLYARGETAISTQRNEGTVARNSIVIFDLGQTMQSQTKGMRGTNLMLPRNLFDSRIGEVANLHGSILPAADGPLLRLLGAHMSGLGECLDTADQHQIGHIVASTISLCNASFTASSDSAYAGGAVANIEMRQFIETNLGLSELGPDLIGTRFGMSRTALYAVFESEGGVMSYIRNRRLARAMRMLSGAEHAGPRRRISTIGYACGFGTEKMFSRAFRRRYGMNPRDVGAGQKVLAARDRSDLLLSWMRDL